MNAYIAYAKDRLHWLTSAHLALLSMLLPVWVHAEEAAQPLMQNTPMASAGKVALFLVLILGMIVGLAWLVNKTRVGQWAGSGQHLKMLAVLPVGHREKVAIIQAGEQQLVIGITSNGITTLTELKEPLTIQEQKTPDFADILKKAVRK